LRGTVFGFISLFFILERGGLFLSTFHFLPCPKFGLKAKHSSVQYW
jgi:hypothetical protein